MHTPLEVASALRKASEWLLNPRDVRIRGRRLGRSAGNIVVTNTRNAPVDVCLIGAAWYALDDPQFRDSTDDCLDVLAMGSSDAHHQLEEAYHAFDCFVEVGGRRTKEGRAYLEDALNAINAAALEIEKMIKTDAKERKSTRTRKREKSHAGS